MEVGDGAGFDGDEGDRVATGQKEYTVNMPWVLVDMSFMGHRALHTTKGMSYDDRPTGVIFGFFDSLRALCFDPRIASNRVALFFDSKSSVRSAYYPMYKRKRYKELTKDELFERRVLQDQLRLLRTEILPAVGFPVFRAAGYESDDLIAEAAMGLKAIAGPKFTYTKKDLQAVIVTADNDLYQCISWNVQWYDPIRDLWLDPNSFFLHKGVGCHEWAQVKQLAGCRGDGVKGVPGVGEKTAIDYLHNRTISSKRRQAIYHNQDVIKMNTRLTSLPHHGTPRIELKDPVYNRRAFYQWAHRLGMNTFLKSKRDEWSKFFDGVMSPGRQTPRRRGERRGR